MSVYFCSVFPINRRYVSRRKDQEERRGDVGAGREELVGISEAGCHGAEEQGRFGQVPVAERTGRVGQRLGGEKSGHVPAAQQEAAAGRGAQGERQDGEEAAQAYAQPAHLERSVEEHARLQALVAQVTSDLDTRGTLFLIRPGSPLQVDLGRELEREERRPLASPDAHPRDAGQRGGGGPRLQGLHPGEAAREREQQSDQQLRGHLGLVAVAGRAGPVEEVPGRGRGQGG